MLSIVSLTLGPVMTNTYLLADNNTGEAVVIDPADDGDLIHAEIEKRNWHLVSIWLTHAHFDHLGGTAELADLSNPPPPIALHIDDIPLWRIEGGAAFFGMKIDPGPEPTIELKHGQVLHIGEYQFQVLHAPGHTPGHVMFYNRDEAILLCGDVIFQGSIGRTDLPGGDFDTLINSIRRQVMVLPDDTRLLCGHGPQTTVRQEKIYNPFLQ
jgi:glyoxylase-like metal-dependent hydrolase (beta-lactamase superfamily II)